MAVDDRLSDLLVDWEQSRRSGVEASLEELCRDTPELLPVLRESIDSLRATQWMLEPQPSEPSIRHADPAAFNDTELPASHLTAQEFAASIFQSGLLSREEIAELRQRLNASDLPGEAREIASKLVAEGKLTRYQAAVLLKASKDPLLIDNYVILDTLDTGGMGLVFKALHRSMNRIVALKLLPAAMMSARDTVKRFQREVQAAAALKHPNIVAAYDADESAEVAYLVLEYVEGVNLYRLVKDQGPRPLIEAANYVCQAARGLAYLHSRRIIHRDVKPANLILANDGTVKLLDMGLVRFASSEDLSCCEMDQELTQAGIVIGTVAYMSPEQALDTRSADQRSDIYSLGCTLFFLLTGRSLYHEETGMKTLLAHREQPVPSIREFCEEAPVSLDAVFRTMVAKRPADRLQSMEEVIAAIEACVPGVRPSGELAAGSTAKSPKTSKLASAERLGPRKWQRSVIAGVIAAALIAGVYMAVVLIRIKTKQGTMEISTDDPNPKIEIVHQPQAASAVAKVPATGLPRPKVSFVHLGVHKTGFLPEDDPNMESTYQLDLLAATPAEERAALAMAFETDPTKITEAIESVIQSAKRDDLKSPGVAGFEKRLTAAINKVLPRACVLRAHPVGIWRAETRQVAQTSNAAKETLTSSERRSKPVPVVTATVRKGDFTVHLTEPGNVVASQTVTVRPRVDGEIVKVYFKEGQIVHAGDPLFDIDPRPYQTRLEEEKAQIQRDEAAAAQARKALERGQNLHKARSISAEELDALSVAAEQSRAAIQKDQARAEDAMLKVGYCHITAPISGRIGLRVLDQGNIVRASGNDSLAVIVQQQPIAIMFSVPQSAVFGLQQKLSSGNESKVEAFDAGGPKLATGKLVGFDNRVGPDGTIRAKSIFANDDGRLYPGQYVACRLAIDTLHDVVLVPTSAVLHVQSEGTFAFVLRPDQTVAKRNLVIGAGEQAENVVTSGLSPGDVVVVQGADKLVNGAKVELRTSNSGISNGGK